MDDLIIQDVFKSVLSYDKLNIANINKHIHIL